LLPRLALVSDPPALLSAMYTTTRNPPR